MSHIVKRILIRKAADFKVHILREGHIFLQNLHRRFVLYCNGQIYGGDFTKFCDLLRIYELYEKENRYFLPDFHLQVRRKRPKKDQPLTY